MANIRGAREFLIGYGKSHPSQLSAQEREMMGRWYGVTSDDYDRIASSIKTTVKRESKAGSYEQRQAKKQKRMKKAPAKQKRMKKAPAKQKRMKKAPAKQKRTTAAELKRRACASKYTPPFLKRRYC